jgi:hypothetical protein
LRLRLNINGILVLDEVDQISSSAIQNESTVGIIDSAIAVYVIELAIDVSDIISHLRCGVVESVNVDLKALLATSLADDISELVNNFTSFKDKVGSAILICEMQDLT